MSSLTRTSRPTLSHDNRSKGGPLPLHAAANRGVFYLLLAGIVIFSGSLYVLAVTNIHWLGAITPIGGLCFLAGWAWLAISPPR